MQIEGANVVVTGASQGIGEQIAARFAERGAQVVVIARSGERLQEVADRIGGHSIVADLSTADGVDGVVERCESALGGPIDVLVNNAGIETNDAFVHTDRDEIRTLARLNFEAPLLLTRDVLPAMIRRGSGHIVQMSSVASTIPFPGLTAYAGTKAGLTNFTESLRVELRGSGVGLTVVSPGPVDTAMWDRVEAKDHYQAAALRRFKRLMFLPKLDAMAVAERTVDAVERDRPHVRLPTRYNIYHILNQAPRNLVRAAMIGVKLPTLSVGTATDT